MRTVHDFVKDCVVRGRTDEQIRIIISSTQWRNQKINEEVEKLLNRIAVVMWREEGARKRIGQRNSKHVRYREPKKKVLKIRRTAKPKLRV